MYPRWVTIITAMVLLAHLFEGDRNWIQGALLARGMARFTLSPTTGHAPPKCWSWKRLRGWRGIWGNSFYGVRDAMELP